MVDATAHRESNRKHYQNSVKTNMELMNIRRMNALAYYYKKVQPFREKKQPKPKKVNPLKEKKQPKPKKVKPFKENKQVKSKVKDRLLSIEKKHVYFFLNSMLKNLLAI